MSNLIKYPFVNMQGKEVRTISYEKKSEFKPLEKKSKVFMRPASEVENLEEEKLKELVLAHGDSDVSGDSSEDGFEEGISVTHIEDIVNEKLESAKEEAEQILSQAEDEAKSLISDAQNQADDIKERAHSEGIELGKSEGMAIAQSQIDEMKATLEQNLIDQQNEYREMIDQIEPRYVKILSELIQKITGVIMEDQKDLILHLIRTGLEDVEDTGKVTVRVNPEDATVAIGYKDELEADIDADITLEIKEDSALGRAECIIETENQMLDAGIHTQINNLLNTLKLIV